MYLEYSIWSFKSTCIFVVTSGSCEHVMHTLSLKLSFIRNLGWQRQIALYYEGVASCITLIVAPRVSKWIVMGNISFTMASFPNVDRYSSVWLLLSKTIQTLSHVPCHCRSQRSTHAQFFFTLILFIRLHRSVKKQKLQTYDELIHPFCFI